ncbi:MAG: 4-phosphoerythronate dehydrogenase [Pseudohongiellaceae bacterium]
MKIVADENLKDVEKQFAGFGDVILLPGREINASSVKDADVLLVRSVTPVSESLLRNSVVKFVGTATSGTEHVDQSYLASRNIAFAHAHGSNAQAVVDYCIAVLFSNLNGFNTNNRKTIGIIGLGAVGFRLAMTIRLLDCAVIAFDPLLSEEGKLRAEALGIQLSQTLASVFSADVVSLHTPLTETGEYPTRYMVGSALLNKLPKDAVFINASRGGVVNQKELLQFLKTRPDVFSVLDVWEDEPHIDLELLSTVSLATPHFAGYSRNGKILATKMLRDSLNAHLGKPLIEKSEGKGEKYEMAIGDSSSVAALLSLALPVSAWSRKFKQEMLVSKNVAQTFDETRKSMIDRREIADCAVNKSKLEPAELMRAEKLGFDLRA